MLPEILSVPVPAHFITDAPDSYRNFGAHVEKVKRDIVQKQERNLSRTAGGEEVSRRNHGSGRRDNKDGEMECVEGMNVAVTGRVVDAGVDSVTEGVNVGTSVTPGQDGERRAAPPTGFGSDHKFSFVPPVIIPTTPQ